MSVRTPAVCLVLTALAPIVAAQAEPDPGLARDTAFVRALVRELRFVSLAQSEVARMQVRHKDSEAAVKSIAQLDIEVSLIGAKMQSNREEKRTLFKEGLERVSKLVERFEGDPVALQGRVTMADATIEFGRFLAEEVEIARVENPDKVPALEEEAQKVFRAGIDACERAMAELEKTKDRNPRDKTEFHVCWLRKGILQREQARAVKKDRSYLCDLSRQTLEDLIFEVGEETLLGQKALLEYAQNDEVLGRAAAAAQSYTDVIESVYGSLSSAELELPAEVRELMVVLMEEAYDRRGNVLFQLGKTDEVLATVKEYRERLKALDVPLTEWKADGTVTDGSEDPQFGHSLYITEAQAMAESGKADLVARGLEQAKYFDGKHPNDLVGLKAKNVIREIMEAQSNLVSGALLLTVAEGDVQAKNYESATINCKKALAAMDAAELAKEGLRAYLWMGRAFAAQGRTLEASIALATGLQKHGSTSSDEDLPAQAASLLDRTMNVAKREAKDDAHLASLSGQVDTALRTYGGVKQVSERFYRDGLGKLAANEYQDAIAELSKVEKTSAWYELAATTIVSAYQRADDLAGARKALDDYRTFVGSSDGKIADDDRARQQTRQTGLARAAFFDGYLTYLTASEGQGDVTKYPEVIKLLGDFPQTYGSQAPELVPRVHYVLGRCYVAIGQLDKAEERYRTLINEAGKNHPTVPVLASSILAAYHARIQAAVTELAALEKGGDEAAARKAREGLTLLRRQALAIGLEYLKNSDDPLYGNVFSTLQVAEELEDWAQVESLGNQIIQVFSKGRDKKKVDKYVKEIVGAAVLRQHKYQQAYDLFVDVEKANPNKLTIKRQLALALGGWIEINERGQVERWPGIGKPAEAYEKYWTEYKPYGLHPDTAPRYSLEWYRFHLECLYFARRAAAEDSAFKARADALYNIAEANDDFRTLAGLGAAGRDMADLFRQLR